MPFVSRLLGYAGEAYRKGNWLQGRKNPTQARCPLVNLVMNYFPVVLLVAVVIPVDYLLMILRRVVFCYI